MDNILMGKTARGECRGVHGGYYAGEEIRGKPYSAHGTIVSYSGSTVSIIDEETGRIFKFSYCEVTVDENCR